MKVLKFGGTSVLNAVNIEKVRRIISGMAGREKNLAVVFSAFGGVTDHLIRTGRVASQGDENYLIEFKAIRDRHELTIRELGLGSNRQVRDFVSSVFSSIRDLLHGVYLVRELSPRTMDFISGQGEILSAYIISLYFRQKKLNASFLDARTVIRTDEQFGAALVDFDVTDRQIRNHFRKSKGIQVITGFVASTSNGETTTLGRGGSDYTAAIFGAALNASEIQIWTDVDGVLTADPRKVRKAFPVTTMTYTEAMEMSHFGAKVIHPPTIQPALNKRIPLRIRNTFNPEHGGTYISTETADPAFLIRGISSIDDIALLTLQGSGMVGVAGISARLFGALSSATINVIMITQGSSEHTITFAVRPEDAYLAKKKIEEAFRLEIQAGLIERVRLEKDLSVIAVIGENMRNTPGVSGKLYQALGKNGISVVATAQGSSELNITTVIHRTDLDKALNSLHQAFFLSNVKTLSVFLVGTGLIGKTLLKQIQSHSAYLRETRSLEIIIAGIANSRRMYFNPDGIDIRKMETYLDNGQPMDMDEFARQMHLLNLPQSIFVDCTSNAGVVERYNKILENSISIVTPNKLANSGKYSAYNALRTMAKQRNVRFLYETNVGAGLPVISTLSDLIHSGDKIRRIEAVLSGTLSFIFNNFTGGKKFSDIVREAQRRGYTEPDPRVDLSGTDVARKLMILARETGLKTEMKDIRIQQILPPSCVRAKTVEEFFAELEKHNDHFEEMVSAAEKKKKVLRFIAKLENNRCSISLEEVDSSHPFYNLSGSDNIVSFTTDRYRERPLVVKGPGAGAEVTAAGVFAEIISIGKYFE